MEWEDEAEKLGTDKTPLILKEVAMTSKFTFTPPDWLDFLVLTNETENTDWFIAGIYPQTAANQDAPTYAGVSHLL